MKTENNIKCNNCDWVGHEDDLYLIEFDINDETETPTAFEEPNGIITRLKNEPEKKDFSKGCPNCLTDNYLMDLV